MKSQRDRKPWGAIFLFIAPIAIYYAIFIIYPFISTFYYSFFKIAPAAGKIVTTYVGIENYKNVILDDIFQTAARNTAIWGVLGPTLELLSAVVLSTVIYFKVPFHRIFRTTWFFPVLVSGVIVGLVFRWIFNFEWGLINASLRAIGLDKLAVDWLGRKDTPLLAVIFVHWWSTFGISVVLFLAGLTAIPYELVEAAFIDGASVFQVISSILLPLLKPTFVTVLILSFIGKMRAFNVVWVLTQGGPVHYSETVATYIQKRAFHWSSVDMGYPSAMAVIWFGVVVVGVGLIRRWLQIRLED